jgi:hypothetical protein
MRTLWMLARQTGIMFYKDWVIIAVNEAKRVEGPSNPQLAAGVAIEKIWVV